MCMAATLDAPITSDSALRVARSDAEKVYDCLDKYRITVQLREDGWHVDYELIDPGMKGGGPHYVVDSTTGEIVSKRYEQ